MLHLDPFFIIWNEVQVYGQLCVHVSPLPMRVCMSVCAHTNGYSGDGCTCVSMTVYLCACVCFTAAVCESMDLCECAVSEIVCIWTSVCVYLSVCTYVRLCMYLCLCILTWAFLADPKKGLAVVLNPFNKPLSPKINLYYDS